MQRRFSGTDDSVRNHYRVITDVPVIGTYPLPLAPAGPASAMRGICTSAAGIVWQDYRCGWAVTYDIRRFNDELVVRVCYRP